MIIDLDTEAGLDPGRVGAKAAWLAMGRRAGLPVLPGFAVDAVASRHHMELGTATLATRGSGGARLTIGAEPVPEVDRLIEAGAKLGDSLVARSSTSLEASGEWSGAFSSYVDVTPDELPKAVSGCWASAFTVSALERQEAAGIEPGSFLMAVLVQRALEPLAGGTAQIEDDGSVEVHGVKGSPAPLLQGWSNGHRARVSAHSLEGDEMIELIGFSALDEIAQQLRTASSSMAVTQCEWALQDRIWLLQLGTRRPRPTSGLPMFDLADPGLVPIARAAARAPGKVGEELVLPWALAGLPPPVATTTLEPASLLSPRAAVELRDRLVAGVWDLPPGQAMEAARQCMNGIIGDEPGVSLARVHELRAPDPEMAHRLLDHVDASLSPGHATRLGVGRWEPFIAAVTLAFGTHHVGTTASPGVGAGRRAHIDEPGAIDRYKPRDIVTAPQPLPNLAPLLWDAPGLVTETGSPAAHLFESARALAIPAVCGVALPRGEMIVAVDGTRGIVATIPMNGDDGD